MDDSPRNGRDDTALRRHYMVERELADRLRTAPAEDRKVLYRTVYDELFRRVPDHPQHSRKVDPARHRARIDEQVRLLTPFLHPGAVFLEVGAGDCHLPMKIAGWVRQVYAVDVSDVISATVRSPHNFALRLSDGISIPVPPGTVTVAYSNMLLEHLHPEDAVEHACEVYRVLAPGGVYVCRTPHRFSGPQDISQYFDEEATGFHMKEYNYAELRSVLLQTGFATTTLQAQVKGRPFRLPQRLVLLLERLLGQLPHRPRKRLARSRLLRNVFGTVTVIARKGG